MFETIKVFIKYLYQIYGSDAYSNYVVKLFNRLFCLQLIINRGNAGYGFTVTGSCPVKVGSVRVWGASHEAGLQEGDFFVRINGLNVSRSSVESVAKIVR